MNIFSRAKYNLSLATYGIAKQDVVETPHPGLVPPAEDQYILRMMVRCPGVEGFRIPPELRWLRDTIERVDNIQNILFQAHPYVYVTVRNGIVNSATDDEWHVDGFSMRIAHKPEQNYIWTDCHSTEYLEQQFQMPDDFDPFRHNIHNYFQDNADCNAIRTMKEKHISLIDPYIVHRRPTVPVGVRRCFLRISFVPIEIEDDTCTQNPLLPPKVYGRVDIRKNLSRYANE